MASVLDLIGETPLIEATRFDCGPCRLFLKLESANPSGSIKDRPARSMIDAAESEVMVTRLETISADAPIRELVPLFRRDLVAIVMDGGRFLGTRLDLINYFRIVKTR
jgi:hypothetical protein